MAEARAPRVAVVFHSAKGHTAVVAQAVGEGAEGAGALVSMLPVEAMDDDAWRTLADADAIVFGCPTHMGSVSAPMKAFMDASSDRAWFTQAWKDKLAAGFTNSSGLSGDKLNTLVQLSVFAAQHSMVWVSLGLMPGNRRGGDEPSALNRLGSHLGAMAQSDPGVPPSDAPPESDRATARALGERVAGHAARWIGAPLESAPMARHPTTQHWVFPPDDRPPPPAGVERTNLRLLAARPERIEHHLVVVGTVGPAQIELVTASEPLPFAHQNISDEYAVALRTGDSLLEPLRFLTLLTDPESGDDVGRIRHGLEDLVLHPHGLLHWPGRLRPPHEPFRFGPGMRRAGLSFVFCGRAPIAPDASRPLFVSEGRATDTKAYEGADPAFLLVDLDQEAPQALGRIGDVTLGLQVGGELAPAQGGFALILKGDGAYFPGDLLRLDPGAALSLGSARALVVAGPMAPDPSPASWREVPPPPFPTAEEGPAGELPLTRDGLAVTADGDWVRLQVGASDTRVPRYWLARFLFRVALHRFRLGYVETYGGFYYDDRTPGSFRIGLRGGESVDLDREAIEALVEQLYRAVVPPDYVERLE